MYQRQLRRKLPKHPHRRWLIVDEDAPLAVRNDLAPQQNMVRIGVNSIRLEDRGSPRRHLENTAYDSLFRSMTNDLRRRFSSQQKGERIDQNGFSRARLPRQQVEPKPEGRDRTIDHSIVFRAQFQQHRSLNKDVSRG
jgi:hypothetical protein